MAALVVQVVFILIDRFLYLNKPIPKRETAKDSGPSSLLQLYYFPEFNYSLVLKYAFLCLQLVFIHILTFWILPNRANYRLTRHRECTRRDIENSRCNEVYNNQFLLIFYLLCCAYFAFSAMQVKAGWPEAQEGAIKKSANQVNMIATTIYMAMPFLWELEQFICWLWTNTSFTIMQWFKFEEVYSNLYMSKCNAKDLKKKGAGTKISRPKKYAIGGGGLLLLLMLIVAPIFLFSTLNPLVSLNNVQKATMVVTLDINTSLSFEMFRSSRPKIVQVTDRDSEGLELYDQTRAADLEQIQIIGFPTFSDSYIFPTNDTRQTLLSQLQQNMDASVSIQYVFTRAVNLAHISVSGRIQRTNRR